MILCLAPPLPPPSPPHGRILLINELDLSKQLFNPLTQNTFLVQSIFNIFRIKYSYNLI